MILILALQALDKDFIQDITSAYRDVPMEKDVLNRVCICTAS